MRCAPEVEAGLSALYELSGSCMYNHVSDQTIVRIFEIGNKWKLIQKSNTRVFAECAYSALFAQEFDKCDCAAAYRYKGVRKK